ncbi:uncharacterized protein LOC111364505 isoform X2 [Spodoptera litura]|uniref:Uncharacterized protein LOC111364505 isoform X2 n=1 Tax=Spodoptera litura TaxID=69820 RepID=A0A9J7J0C9_SPOLT|nr:uncharacterized protein LOC111364505 isoform X2 [Spodoptera litura]
MARKKIELFTDIHNEKEFDHMLKTNSKYLICAEIYSYAFGSCSALDRLFNTIKMNWADGKLMLLKVPANEIKLLQRFRNQSEPVYIFILNSKVTKVFRGVDPITFAEVAKYELYCFHRWRDGDPVDRPLYEIDEVTSDEMDWITVRKLEKEQDASALNARRSARQAVRKHHRAELMVPFLNDINFVIFWPHCYHAHPELYEQWDANNIIMIGREEIEITEDKVSNIFYAGDAPLNEASLHKLKSGPALAICFRLLDADRHFVSLVRRILYEDIPPYDETQGGESLRSMKTAYDRYKTYSPSKEEIWRQRKEEEEERKEEQKRCRARFMSETRRLAREAVLDAIEAKKKEKELKKLELLKSGNLEALEVLNATSDAHLPAMVSKMSVAFHDDVEEEEEEEFVIDESEYFPPAGLLIPGFYAPPNDIAKANGLAVLFPKLVLERVTPNPEFLPPHVLALLEISKRHKAIEAIAPFKRAIINMGIFEASSPYRSVHIAYTVKQFDTLDSTSLNLDKMRLAFMLSMEVDVPLLHLMDLNPLHVSRDCAAGEEECAAMFPVNYGDEYNQFEDFD